MEPGPMEPVTAWSAERVSGWLRGLDVSLQHYGFEEWQLSGTDLLQLSAPRLEQLGVHKIGHQELILEAVEKLCSLTYSLGGESLRSVTEKVRAVAHTLQMSVQGRWRTNTYDGRSATNLPAHVLQDVVEVITAAKSLFYLLNRYPYTQLSEHTGEKNIITLCQDLGSIISKEVTVYEKEKDIISISRQLVAICDEILSNAPESLLAHTAQIQCVDLVPVSPGEQLGVEITSTNSGHHYVSGTTAESPAETSEKILAGDEVLQVNDQTVVGWSRKNLVAKLQENPNAVTLVLRRVPGTRRHAHKPDSLKPTGHAHSGHASSGPVHSEREEEEEEEDEEEERKRQPAFQGVTGSIRSLSFRAAVTPPDAQGLMGQEESELFSESILDGNQTYTSLSHQQGAGSEAHLEHNPLGLEVSPDRRSPSPLALDSNRARFGSCPDMGAQMEEKENKKSSTKGTRTAMSRRRVSCRELGRPDCDGWLWKKRKDSTVFMTHKWQRFWFVLKGATIYWYMSQHEEKAVGLVKIGSYNIESAGEHKRKYVFRMCHPRFQSFFFAADNATDMSKWINSLISTIQKYKRLQQNPPDSETDCYSETESEEDLSNSPHALKKKVYTKTQFNSLPRTLGRKSKAPAGAINTPPEGGSKAAAMDEMSVMFTNLKKGGVSLIGQEQPNTHEMLRRSFVRRNKNPIINEKVHSLRALHSTLKSKEAELQLIEKLLEESEITGKTFRQWKRDHEDLHLEIERLAAEKKLKSTQPTAAETPPTKGGACNLNLSDGEQLVDAELPKDSAHESKAENVDPAAEKGEAENNPSDNYFYI